jgi:hypothetical protein
VSKSTDKNRLATAVVVLMAVSFGLLSLAKYTRPLLRLSHSHSFAFANARLHLTRNAIEEASPTGSRLRALASPAKRLLVGLEATQMLLRPVVITIGIWPESGQLQHRRIPASSPDDPASI